MKRPEDLGKAAESILMMAQLSKESVEQVAGSMGGLMQIYAGIEGPQENLAKRMQMLSDTLAVAANVGTKSIAEYAQALKRFAFTAKAHGMTLDESMSAVVAMTDSGIDNAGKKFRNLLLLTDKWSVMYPKLAIDDKDGKGATANLIKSAEQIQKLASQGRRGRIQLGAIFGKENVEGAMAMANATKKYLDTQTALDAKKGKLSAMWGSFAQDPSIQLDMLLNNLKLFIQEGLKPVLKFLGEIALVINTIIQFFKVKDTDGFLTVLFKENAWKAVAVLASVVVGALLILVGTVGLITAAFAVLGTQQMLNNVLTSLGNQSLREQTRQMMANTAAAWANARAKAAVATSTVASTGTVATSSAVITGGAVMAGGAVPAVVKAGLFAGLITTLKGVLAAVFTALGGWIGILIVGLIAAITVGAIYMFKKNKKSAEGAASVSAGESYFTKSSDSFNQNNKVTIQGMIAIKDEGSNVKKATMSSSNGLIGMSMVV
jgi:TP901 family phage tail tape measure protein